MERWSKFNSGSRLWRWRWKMEQCNIKWSQSQDMGGKKWRERWRVLEKGVSGM